MPSPGSVLKSVPKNLLEFSLFQAMLKLDVGEIAMKIALFLIASVSIIGSAPAFAAPEDATALRKKCAQLVKKSVGVSPKDKLPRGSGKMIERCVANGGQF